jgi:hypothetical protein
MIPAPIPAWLTSMLVNLARASRGRVVSSRRGDRWARAGSGELGGRIRQPPARQRPQRSRLSLSDFGIYLSVGEAEAELSDQTAQCTF